VLLLVLSETALVLESDLTKQYLATLQDQLVTTTEYTEHTEKEPGFLMSSISYVSRLHYRFFYGWLVLASLSLGEVS
jgi:hypothetical protein